ncbi:hypothetical protein D3C77_452440 [compost metagenome]
MYNGELPAVIGMRMRVHIRWLAMGSPAGMSDPGRTYKRRILQLRFQVGQTADRLGDLQTFRRKYSDAG